MTVISLLCSLVSRLFGFVAALCLAHACAHPSPCNLCNLASGAFYSIMSLSQGCLGKCLGKCLSQIFKAFLINILQYLASSYFLHTLPASPHSSHHLVTYADMWPAITIMLGDTRDTHMKIV